MRAKVLLTSPIHPKYQKELEKKVEVVVAPDTSADALRNAIRDCDGVIVRTHLPPDIFDHAPKLRAVVRHGVGLDLIPLEQATARKIPVANLPGANTIAVVEYALAAIFLIRRNLALYDRTLREKGWQPAKQLSNDAIELAASTCGIIGMGSIGTRLARYLHALEMKVIGLTRRPQTMPDFVEAVSKEELLSRSDIIVLACPHNAETHHMIDAQAISFFKPGAAIINVARGPVIDTAALIDGLRNGKVGAAVLDVHEPPILSGKEEIFNCPNTWLTPHVAGITASSMETLSRQSVETLLALLDGQRPGNVVNPQVFD